MDKLVTVVVVTHNSQNEIGTLLDCLPGAAGEVSYQVVVVDCGSTDTTVRLASRRDGVTVIELDNIGYAGGLNRGIAAVPDADFYLLLNPDVILSEQAIPRMLSPFVDPRVGIVAPRVREADGTLTRSLRREPTLPRAMGLGRTRRPVFDEYVSDSVQYDFGHPVDWALGAVLMTSRLCLDTTGLLDESFFLYSEETEYCLRARSHGYLTWFEPTAESMHIGGASGTSALTHSMQVINRVRLYRRRNNAWMSSLYFGFILLGELSWWIRGNRYSLTAVKALLIPRMRPHQLNACDHLLPT